MNILLAIDFSKGSQLALDEAAARPWPAGTEFLALNVLDIRGFARFPAVIDDAKRQAASGQAGCREADSRRSQLRFRSDCRRATQHNHGIREALEGRFRDAGFSWPRHRS
jgi:hypothetical protein